MSDASGRPKLKQPFLLDDPDRVARRARIGRIVRLMAGVVAGALVAGALLYVALWHWQRENRYVRVLRDDLTRLAAAQQEYRSRTGAYGSLDSLGRAFVPSQAVWMRVQVSEATWRAAARHDRADTECWVEGSAGRLGDVECG